VTAILRQQQQETHPYFVLSFSYKSTNGRYEHYGIRGSIGFVFLAVILI